MDQQPKKNLFQKAIDNYITKTVGIIVATVAVLSFFFGPVLTNKERIQTLELTTTSQQDVKDSITNLKENHLHTLQETIERIEAEQKEQALQLVELKTILDERLPK